MAVAQETVTELEKQFHCIAVCNLCQRTFTNPKILLCFHTFCFNCLNENTRRNLGSGSTPNCPKCRVASYIPKQGFATLRTNEYIYRIIATANALSPILGIDLSSFRHTDGFASPRAAADSYDCRHYYGRDKSTTQIVHSAKSRVKSGRVFPEEGRQSYQRMSYCQKHRMEFENYCSDCMQVICPLCNERGHRYHQVISIASATKDLRHMMDNYFIGIKSCYAYYIAQTAVCETAREGRTAAVTVNRMDSTPVRPDCRGNFISGRYAQLLPASPLSSPSLDTWKGYTRRFYEAITTRWLGSDILNISKQLQQLQETWHHVYEQDSTVQQSQNKNSFWPRVHSPTREIEIRRDLEVKEQRMQKLLSEQMEWVADEKRLKDVIKKQSEEKCWMEANLNEQETKYLHLKTERDWLPGELQLTYINEKAISDKKEKQLMKERLESQTYAINNEKEYFATQYEFETKSHDRCKSQVSEHFEQNFKRMLEKQLCNDSLKEFKSEKEQLEAEPGEEQQSKADIQNKLTEQVRNRSELEQLISWIERIDIQPADFHVTKESGSQNSIIEKLRASIIKKIKASEKERLLVDRNEELNHHVEELKSRASIEQMTQQRNSSSVAMKEHEWPFKEKEFAAIIKKLENKLIEQLQNEKRRDSELEQLISSIERIDTQRAAFQMTTEGHAENGNIQKLQVSIVKKIEELSAKERHLLNKIDCLRHQVEELKSGASSKLMVHQLKSSDVADKERICMIREKQDADQIQELESQIDQLKGDLTQQQESNRTTEGQLEASLRKESHLTAEVTDLKQRLRLADKKQEDDIGLLRDSESLIKWIERGGRQLTEGQVTTEGESENSIIKKIKTSIIRTTEELRDKEKQLLQTIEGSDQQIAELRQRLATEEANQRKLHTRVTNDKDKLMHNIQLMSDGEKQLNARVQELEHQVTELQQSLTSEQQMHQASLRNSDANLHKQLRENDRIREAQVKQHYDEIHDLQNEILKLREVIREKEGQYLAGKKQEDDIGLLRGLENMIKWMERGDIQPTEDQMTTEGESENSIIWKMKTSIINTTKELRAKEKQLLQTIEESGHQLTELRQRLATEEANHRKLHKELTGERDKLMQNIQLLKNDKKQLNAKVQELESQIHDEQDALTQQKECNNSVKEQLKAALIKNEDYTSLKQRLEHSLTYKNELGLIQVELELLIQWIDSIDKQSADKKTIGEELQNHAVQKLKVSIKKKTNELKATEKLLSKRISVLEHQVTELQQSLAREQENLMHQTALRISDANLLKQLEEKDRILEAQVKQHYDEILDLQNEILKLREELRQQEGQYLADKKQEDDTTLLRELQNLIKWLDRGDIQPTEDQMTMEGESENSIIWKIKASIIKTTKDLRDKEKQLLQTIEESDQRINELRQLLINEENNHRKLDKEFASERGNLVQKIQLLKTGEKQLNVRVQELEHQVTELQQSLTSEEQMHQASLRNSDASLHKQLTEKDRIYEAQVKWLNDEILQLREVLGQQEEQNKSSRKELGQVATREATLNTDMTDLRHQRMNTKNTYDNSTDVQIAACRKATVLTPTGISNVGNTCYFGATIQNLVQTFLLAEELPVCHGKQSPKDVEQLLTNAYVEFIPRYYEANCDQTFRLMYETFCKKSSRFADRGQHDSHDLFVNFLNCLRDEERRSLGSANSPGFRNVLTAVDKVFGGHTITVYVCSTCKTPYHVCEPFLDISVPILGPKDGGEDEDEDLFINHLHNPQSIGDDPVRQAVEVTMRALGIRSRLKTPQRIFEKRSLMPESTGDISLKQCLAYYSRTEQIHNEYLCNPCETAGRSSMTSALKRTLIYNPPAVLVLHLKRFEQTTVGFKKCNQRVTYDEYLDIGPYCSSSCLRMREPNDANIWYSLYGVVVHKGSLTSGHYVSYIKVTDCDKRQAKQFMQQTFLNRDQVLNGDEIRRINASRGMVRSRTEWEPKEVEGQWYLADDEYVKAVEKTEALSQAAYLLFYERVAK